jgi:hypothetical protein
MQTFPYSTPLGAPHPLAILVAPPDPAIGTVIAGDSTVDCDGYALGGDRGPAERVAAWWSPTRSFGATAIALFLGGGSTAFILAMVVGVGASEAFLPQSVLPPLVIGAGATGLVLGTALGLRLAHALAFKRGGENLLVGERGVSVVRLRGGALETTTFGYADDVFWATSRTRYVMPGSRVSVGDVITNVWVDAAGRKLYETRDLVGDSSPRTATLGLAMQRRAQVRGPLVRAALERGQPISIPLLYSPEGDSLYAAASVRPQSFLRFERGALTIELDGAPVARLALADLRVVAVDGKCLFRSKGGVGGHDLRMQDTPDALLLAALFA